MLLPATIGPKFPHFCLLFVLVSFSGIVCGEGVEGRLEGVEDESAGDSGVENVDGYEEVKEQLRQIFSHGVNPLEEDENSASDFDDSLGQGFERLEEVSGIRRDDNFPPQRRRQLEDSDNPRSRGFLADRDRKRNLHQPDKWSSHGHEGYGDAKQFLNEWVVHLTGGQRIAAAVAKDLGYEFLGQVGNFKDVYRLVKKDHPSIHKRAAPELTHGLNVHIEVKWAEQQFVKERSKRTLLPDSGSIDDIYDPYAPLVRVKRMEPEDKKEMGSEKIKEMESTYGNKMALGDKKKMEPENEKKIEPENEKKMESKDEKKMGPEEDKRTEHRNIKQMELEEEVQIKSTEETEETMFNGETDEDSGNHPLVKRSAMSAYALKVEKIFNDELWVHQWYLFDTRTRSDLPKIDLQVFPVWQSGVTGKGVKVVVIDDGLEWRHTDIVNNYSPNSSHDFNDEDEDPTPRYDKYLSNSHGTRCAGEIAMAPNNTKCGVGVAYGAEIGGVRMLDGPVSDILEGLSLVWSVGKADIVSCSWGPTDDGQRVEGPGKLAEKALLRGVTQGRDGKGLVYVWAAGNGGSAGDDCNCDGYTSSIYTLSISSASETGLFPWYGERCASTMATAYSSGAYTDQKIATTDLYNSCTDKFSGTSAAAPLAAGIFALALEANPNLTWRDMQHVVVWSSEWAPLANNDGWFTNAKGLKYNSRFGFGLLSAEALVQTARKWESVPYKSICTVSSKSRGKVNLKTGESVLLEYSSTGCEGTKDEVRSLEHVQVIANIDYTKRGALSVTLTSPSGTQSVLLNERADDRSQEGFRNWALMSVHTWGEDPRGIWILNITDQTSGDEHGTIGEMELVLHGTKDIPKHLNQARLYRIPFKESPRSNVVKTLTDGLTAEALKTLPWEKLVELFQHSTRSTFTDDDIKFLLREGRLAKAVQNSQSERKFDTNKDSDWRILLDEVLSRK